MQNGQIPGIYTPHLKINYGSNANHRKKQKYFELKDN